MRTKTTYGWLLGAFLLGASGCAVQSGDPDEFRDAIPKGESVTVGGPEGSNTAAAPLETARLAEVAHFYKFTRGLRDGVNAITGVVLGGLWLIVHTEPTTIEADEAIWGPYTDALDPVSWRLRVTRVAEGEYDYALEGRPKASDDDADYQAALSGHGFGRAHSSHGQGGFRIDVDVLRELDPVKHDGESGVVTITHDLPSNITRNPRALPRVITADVTKTGSDERFTVTSTANEDGTGSLSVVAKGNIDDDPLKPALEDVSIDSRWRETGAGRSDIEFSGGDVPADVSPVTAVECWGTDFARVYYKDSVDFSPQEGDPAACAF